MLISFIFSDLKFFFVVFYLCFYFSLAPGASARDPFCSGVRVFLFSTSVQVITNVYVRVRVCVRVRVRVCVWS